VGDSIGLEITELTNPLLDLDLVSAGRQGFLQTKQFAMVDSGDVEVNFFYRTDPQLRIKGSELSPLKCNNDIYLLAEGDQVLLELEAFEEYIVDGEKFICKLDTGAFAIFDYISDRTDSLMVIEKADSTYRYMLKAGDPN